MGRRTAWMAGALAVLLLLPAAPGLAAEVRLVEPENGEVTDATPLRVRVDRTSFPGEPIRQVYAQLRRNEEALGDPLRLTCRRGCDDDQPYALFDLPDDAEFDPATGEPFTESGPLANGAYRLRIEVRRGRFLEPQTFFEDLHLAVRPSAPAEVTAERDGDEVELRWRRAPEPDVSGYRVERRDGDDWEVLRTTSGDRHVDEPGEGTHRYRVVAERPDGRGGILETPSETKEVEVPGERAGTDGENGEDGEDGEGRTGNGNGNGNGNGEDEQAEARDDDAESSSQTRRRGGGSGGANAPSVGSGRNGSIPGIGEGEAGYSTELDYGDFGNGNGGADDVVVANPGGLSGAVGQIFDAERVAVPIAVGLVFTATGLHLWRWLRVPLP